MRAPHAVEYLQLPSSQTVSVAYVCACPKLSERTVYLAMRVTLTGPEVCCKLRVTIISDVTVQRQIEEQLRDAQRMEAIGRQGHGGSERGRPATR